MKIQNYSYTNESFSGCDMVATILMPNIDNGGHTAYTLGEIQTISYSIHMDRNSVRSIGCINAKDYVMGPRTIAGSLVFAVFNRHFATKIMSEMAKNSSNHYAFLADELPPFDIVISAANEYGIRARMVLYGVRLVNEGQVMSVNDVYVENTYQFVATDIDYLDKENGYTKSDNSGRGNYKIIEPDSYEYLAPVIRRYKKPNLKVDLGYELRFKLVKKATLLQKGIMDLWLAPIKKSGFITITGKNVNLVIDVSKAINKSERVSVQLPKGEYSAIWNEGGQKSNKVYFRMLEERGIDPNQLPAPLLEQVTDTTITISPNVRQHSKIIYETLEGKRYSLKVSGKYNYIDGLTANTTYRIATADESLNKLSEFITVTTLPFGANLLNSLLEYLYYNRFSLRNDNFDFYNTVVKDAQTILLEGKRYLSLADILKEVEMKYSKKRSNLKTTDFKNQNEFDNENERLSTLLNACREVIAIAININNDRLYGYNKEVMVVKPPVPEYDDFSTDTFLVDQSVNNLEFYKKLNKVTQYETSISKGSFKPSRKEGFDFACVYHPRPGLNYLTYAVNKYGFRSPRLDFIEPTDEEKANAMAIKKLEEQEKRYAIEKADNEKGYKIKEDVSQEERDKILTEIAKTTGHKKIKAPKILAITEDNIRFEIDEDEALLLRNKIVVVVSPLKDTLINNCKYKQQAKKIVTFNAIDHGLKPNESYSVWIENKDGMQISNCITFDISTEKDYECTDKNEFFVSDICDKLIDLFKSSNVSDETIESIIFKNRSDSDNTRDTVLHNILIDMFDNRAMILAFNKAIYEFYKFYFKTTYSYNSNFFNEPLYINDHSNKIVLPTSCICERVNIADNITTEKYKVSNSTQLLKNEEGISIVSFIDEDFNRRSGFIMINNSTKTYQVFDIEAKEDK